MIHLRKLICLIRGYHAETFFRVESDITGMMSRVACCGCGKKAMPNSGIWKRRD